MQIISGSLKGRKLKIPAGIRPTSGMVKEAVFNIWQGLIENARFLDLCAGAGSMGLEAISRGAQAAVFVEKSPVSSDALQENIRHLGVEKKARLKRLDALVFAQKTPLEDPFDLIFIDPPYASASGEWVVSLLSMLGSRGFLKEGGQLLLEMGSSLSQDDLKGVPLHFLEERKYGKTRLCRFTSLQQDL